MYGEQSNSGFRVTENAGRRKLSEMRREQYRGDEVMKGTERVEGSLHLFRKGRKSLKDIFFFPT